MQKKNIYSTLASLVYWGLFAIFAVILGFQFAVKGRQILSLKRRPLPPHDIIRPTTKVARYPLTELERQVRQIVRKTANVQRYRMQKDELEFSSPL